MTLSFKKEPEALYGGYMVLNTEWQFEVARDYFKVELEVLSYRQTDTVISVYMVRYRYIINNQVKTG